MCQRRVAASNMPLGTIPELQIALREDWDRISEGLFDNLTR